MKPKESERQPERTYERSQNGLLWMAVLDFKMTLMVLVVVLRTVLVAHKLIKILFF